MKKSKNSTKIPKWALRQAKLYGYKIVKWECDEGPDRYNVQATLIPSKRIKAVESSFKKVGNKNEKRKS